MIRMSLLYGLEGPIRSSALSWNRGKVGQVHGYSGATRSERSTKRGADSSPAGAPISARDRGEDAGGERLGAMLQVLSASATIRPFQRLVIAWYGRLRHIA